MKMNFKVLMAKRDLMGMIVGLVLTDFLEYLEARVNKGSLEYLESVAYEGYRVKEALLVCIINKNGNGLLIFRMYLIN